MLFFSWTQVCVKLNFFRVQPLWISLGNKLFRKLKIQIVLLFLVGYKFFLTLIIPIFVQQVKLWIQLFKLYTIVQVCCMPVAYCLYLAVRWWAGKSNCNGSAATTTAPVHLFAWLQSFQASAASQMVQITRKLAEVARPFHGLSSGNCISNLPLIAIKPLVGSKKDDRLCTWTLRNCSFWSWVL